MVKNIYIIIILLVAIVGDSVAQPTFNKLLDHNKRAEVGRPLLEINNNAYLIGYMSSGSSGNILAFEYLDSIGKTLYKSSFRPEASIILENILEVPQGFVVAGGGSDSTGDWNLFLLLLDDSLKQRALYKFNVGIGFEAATAFRITDRNEFVIIGFSGTFPNEDYQAVILKADTAGNEIWRKVIGDSLKGEDCHDVMILDNGDIIMLCNRHQGGQDQDIWVIRTDSMGNIKWDYIYDSPSYARGEQMVLSPDGSSIYIAGGRRLSGAPNYKSAGFLLKIDTTGNKDWEKLYKINDTGWFVGIDLDLNGNIILAGIDNADNHTSLEGYMVKTDQNGNVIWEHLYNPLGKEQQVNEYFYNVIAVSDGGYLAAGFTSKGEESGTQDAWIFKVDSMGQVDTATAYPWVVGMENPLPKEDISAYPNPFTDQCRITIKSRGLESLRWSLYNLQGQALQTGVFESTGHSYFATVHRQSLPVGVYWLAIKKGKGKVVGNKKLVVQ